MKMSEKSRPAKSWLWFALLVSVGVFTRWIPHPPNFSALLAITLVAGLVLPGPLALITPVLSAFAGDLFLGLHDGMWFVYLSLLPLVWIGSRMPEPTRQARTWLSWGAAGLFGNIVFFLLTNLGVWWLSGMYAHTGDGLVTCFAMALPFFHNSVLATWVYQGALAAVYMFAPQMDTKAHSAKA